MRTSRAVELLHVAVIPRLTLLISPGPCGRSCDLIDREIADLIGAIVAATFLSAVLVLADLSYVSYRERQENFDLSEY